MPLGLPVAGLAGVSRFLADWGWGIFNGKKLQGLCREVAPLHSVLKPMCPCCPQRVGPLVAHLCLAARHNALSMTEPLMRAAPCTLPALSLSMCFGALFRDVPPLLALARVCFPSLASLELNTTAGHLLCDFARPDLEDMDEPAAQRETALMGSVVASVKALAGTLTELSLLMSPDIPVCLVPLAALRRLRRLRVRSRCCEHLLRMPAPAQFPCLEVCHIYGSAGVEVSVRGLDGQRFHVTVVGGGGVGSGSSAYTTLAH